VAFISVLQLVERQAGAGETNLDVQTESVDINFVPDMFFVRQKWRQEIDPRIPIGAIR
jgi:hypothetical protein